MSNMKKNWNETNLLLLQTRKCIKICYFMFGYVMLCYFALQLLPCSYVCYTTLCYVVLYMLCSSMLWCYVMLVLCCIMTGVCLWHELSILIFLLKQVWLTLPRRHLLSLIAPIHPQNPVSITMEPAPMSIAAGTLNEYFPMNSLRVPGSRYIQTPTPNAPSPAS